MDSGSLVLVVADGGVARFFARSSARGKLLELLDLRMSAPDSVPETDRPVRVHESHGTARHGVESRMTAHEVAEHRFLRDVAVRMNELAERENVKAMALFASPKALGKLRETMSPAVQAILLATIDKDLVKEPIAALAERLEALRS